jgi:hypothetical protein
VLPYSLVRSTLRKSIISSPLPQTPGSSRRRRHHRRRHKSPTHRGQGRHHGERGRPHPHHRRPRGRRTFRRSVPHSAPAVRRHHRGRCRSGNRGPDDPVLRANAIGIVTSADLAGAGEPTETWASGVDLADGTRFTQRGVTSRLPPGCSFPARPAADGLALTVSAVGWLPSGSLLSRLLRRGGRACRPTTSRRTSEAPVSAPAFGRGGPKCRGSRPAQRACACGTGVR